MSVPYSSGSSLSPVSFLKAQPRMAIFFPVILSHGQLNLPAKGGEKGMSSRVKEGVNDLAGESALLVLVLGESASIAAHGNQVAPFQRQHASTWRLQVGGVTQTGRQD